MDTCVQNPACFSMFDPIAPECIECGIQSECIKKQELALKSRITEEQEDTEKITPQETDQPKVQNLSEPTKPNGVQNIPQHSRKPLEIPPVGSKISASYKGSIYEALIVNDPTNKRGDGRSILFNGTVYRTLTAAARAIAPGINSGCVWTEV